MLITVLPSNESRGGRLDATHQVWHIPSQVEDTWKTKRNHYISLISYIYKAFHIIIHELVLNEGVVVD